MPPLLEHLDDYHARISGGRIGELGFDKDAMPPLKPSEYFARNCWLGVSFPSQADIDARYGIGVDRFLWGSDYPHTEGTWPYTREHISSRFAGVDPDETRRILGGNAAELYGFDLAALAPLVERVGVTLP